MITIEDMIFGWQILKTKRDVMKLIGEYHLMTIKGK